MSDGSIFWMSAGFKKLKLCECETVSAGGVICFGSQR